MSGTVAAAALGGVMVIGASVQRMTGMGFALVSVPVLALLLGPADGVALVNCAAGVVSAVGLASTWRQVRLPAMTVLVAAAACTVPLGTWTAARLPAPVLLVFLGATVSVAVLLVLAGARVASLRGTAGAVVAGGASGFMNAAAGVGGPALSLYAANAEWPMARFVPNALFYGVSLNVFSVAANGLPTLSAAAWLLTLAGLATGTLLGEVLARRVPQAWIRYVVMVLSLIGGLVTVSRGLWQLSGQ
ncbi:sulfite exporter TauE/SafE family protein [Streptomyces chartreusis]|uniref:sulfite exporter TauE/SafE family protein n=1 Tax=Streptomyces chartreusis TaxID=1969 RepID=UPI0033A136CB